MRVVALEEHFTVPRIVAGIAPDAIVRLCFPGPGVVWGQTIKRNELADLGDARLADMDASGITVQVLSVAGPGAGLVPGQQGIDMARAYNDALAEACARHPDRYRGFAHLPMLAPGAAADELERCEEDLGFLPVGQYPCRCERSEVIPEMDGLVLEIASLRSQQQGWSAIQRIALRLRKCRTESTELFQRPVQNALQRRSPVRSRRRHMPAA